MKTWDWLSNAYTKNYRSDPMNLNSQHWVWRRRRLFWADSQAAIVRSGFSERLSEKNNMESDRGRHSVFTSGFYIADLVNTLVCLHVRVHTHTTKTTICTQTSFSQLLEPASPD